MYLTLDVIKGLIDEEEWFVKNVDPSKISDPKTSVMTIFEFHKMDSDEKNDHEDLLRKLMDHKIEILPLTPDMIRYIQDVIDEYSDLFDIGFLESIHIAHSVSLKEEIVSTNPMYGYIDRITHVDPRKL